MADSPFSQWGKATWPKPQPKQRDPKVQRVHDILNQQAFDQESEEEGAGVDLQRLREEDEEGVNGDFVKTKRQALMEAFSKVEDMADQDAIQKIVARRAARRGGK